MAPTPTSVYRYYDDRGVLLYVGITSRGSQRNREHNTTKEWWRFVTRQDVEHFPTRDEAHAREVLLIQGYHPPFNKQHNPDHDMLREIYLAIGETYARVDLPSRPIDLYRAIGKQLPLTPLGRCTDERLKLGTLPQHGAIVQRMIVSNKAIIRAPKKVGRVEGVETYGDRVVLRIVGRNLRAAPIFHLRLKCLRQSPLVFDGYEVLGSAS